MAKKNEQYTHFARVGDDGTVVADYGSAPLASFRDHFGPQGKFVELTREAVEREFGANFRVNVHNTVLTEKDYYDSL